MVIFVYYIEGRGANCISIDVYMKGHLYFVKDYAYCIERHRHRDTGTYRDTIDNRQQTQG